MILKNKRLLFWLIPITIVLIAAVLTLLNSAQTKAPTATNEDSAQTAQQSSTEQVDINTTKNEQIPKLNKTKYSVDDPGSIWIVANKKRPLNPLAYAPNDLVYVNGQQLRNEAASALQSMIQAAQIEGLFISPLSGYRSYTTQQSVYAREVSTYGQAVADTQSARPGHSEHQTGWAVDVGGGGCGIEDCFGDTAEGKWVAANGYKYGFIIRYQPGKEAITGYRAEPWHIRYVGTELAAEIQKTGQSLEEFFGLPAAPTY